MHWYNITNVYSVDNGWINICGNICVHLLEPELRDKNMNVDDVLAGVTLGCQVPHGQFQDCGQWTSQSLHLADNT